MATLLQAIVTKFTGTPALVTAFPGGLWYDVAPRTVAEPASGLAYNAYAEFQVHGPRQSIDRFFGGKDHEINLVQFQTYKLGLAESETAAQLLFDTFDNASLSVTSKTFLSMLAVHPPNMFDHMGPRQNAGIGTKDLYRGTLAFECQVVQA